MRRVRALLSFLPLAWPLLASASCNLDNPGDPPPIADIYLPTGLMLSAQDAESGSAPRYLYLVNSNFDLRYNRGSVQAYDLERLDEQVKACAVPSIQCEIDTTNLLVDEVLVPSLATSFAISPDRKRMYVATRTDPSMTFIDLDESASGEALLDCDETERRCSNTRQRGADPASSVRGAVLPLEPVGMVSVPVPGASADASVATGGSQPNFVLIAHRGGQVSVFFDNATPNGPQLIQVLEGLALEPTGIVYDELSGLAYLSLFARGNSSGLSRLLPRVGLSVQSGADYGASFAYDAGSLVIDGVANQRDTRAIGIDRSRSPEQGQLVVASRDPSALLFVDVTSNAVAASPGASVPSRDIVPVGEGPSRMTFGRIGDREIVAVSCFDGHSVYVLDATTGDVLGIVHNLNGPFELGIDSVRKRMYLADFRTSSVQIIDLEPLTKNDPEFGTDPRILATLGIPKVVQELQ